MFKGIVAKQQAQATEASVQTGDVSVESYLAALEAAEDRFEERSRETELENARNLRTALEQFGGTPDGYRALMAFADADGSLSQAFGLNVGSSLESLADSDVTADAQKLAAGLESYIVGEETPSVEGFREAIHRNKKKIAVLWGLSVLVANFALFRVVAPVNSALGGVNVGITLWVIDKIANSSRVEGSADDVDELLNRTEIALNILKEVSPEAFSDPEKAAGEAASVSSKIKGDLRKLGYASVETRGGTLTVKRDKSAGVSDPARRMLPFKESGWTGDKLTGAVKRARDVGERTKTICGDIEKKVDVVIREAGTKSPAGTYLYDVVDVVVDEAERNLRMAMSCMKSAGKFFTTKSDVKSEGEKAKDEGDKE